MGFPGIGGVIGQLEGFAVDGRIELEPGADDGGDFAVDRGGGEGVVAQGVAGAAAQFREIGQQVGVGVALGGDPVFPGALAGGGFPGAAVGAGGDFHGAVGRAGGDLAGEGAAGGGGAGHG